METAAWSLCLVPSVFRFKHSHCRNMPRHMKLDCLERFLEIVAITSNMTGMMVALLAHFRVGYGGILDGRASSDAGVKKG